MMPRDKSGLVDRIHDRLHELEMESGYSIERGAIRDVLELHDQLYPDDTVVTIARALEVSLEGIGD